MGVRKSLVTLLTIAAVALATPEFADARKGKGTIKGNLNGKFKANIVKSVIYTAANKQLVVAGTQRKGTTAKTLTITCLGVDLVPGPLSKCILTYAILQPLQGINKLWSTGDGGTINVTINSYTNGKINLSFEGTGLGNSSTGGEDLTITGGIVKMAVQAS